ncbi:MAG: hypothetical protein H7096_11570 [Flavobacterium sp.]|nr:hypothetical protein [Pedobacter sp.]
MPRYPAKAYYDHIWSRNLGRCVNEIIESGETERSVKAADNAVKLLYDKSARYSQPNWKRIANGSKLGDDNLLKSISRLTIPGVLISEHSIYRVEVM